jgi:hypothetical protein
MPQLTPGTVLSDYRFLQTALRARILRPVRVHLFSRHILNSRLTNLRRITGDSRDLKSGFACRIGCIDYSGRGVRRAADRSDLKLCLL